MGVGSGRRAVLGGAAASVLARPAVAQSGLPTVKIGVLWDRSGTAAVTSGLDQVVAARLAVDDFGRFSRGYPIELLDAEFERNPEQAADIARQWFDRDGVAAIVGIPGTTAAVRVQELARARDRSVLNTASFSDALTGAACSPVATHWLENANALTRAMTIGLAGEGITRWFIVAPDDPAGLAFQADAARAVESNGGRVIGTARHPPDADNFAPVLSGAGDSGADAIGLCAMGTALQTQIRQAREIGLFTKVRAICAYAASIRDVHDVGPAEARDLWLVSGFYWNKNDRGRAFARRFDQVTGRMPDMPHAATYVAVSNFLRVVESTDSIAGRIVNTALRGGSVYFFGANGRIRLDGTLLLDIGLFQTIPPDDVKESWAYYKEVRSVAASNVFRGGPSDACSLSP